MNGRGRRDWNATKCVVTPSAMGVAFLAIAAALPYRFVVAATLGPAIICTWSAAGIGLYGMARYPSRRLLAATFIALVIAALSGTYYWHLMTADRFLQSSSS